MSRPASSDGGSDGSGDGSGDRSGDEGGGAGGGGDGYAHPVKFDVITANPPFVPVPPAYAFAATMYGNGGADGSDITARVVAGAPQYLAAGGRVSIVTQHVNVGSAVYRERLVNEWWGPTDADMEAMNREDTDRSTRAGAPTPTIVMGAGGGGSDAAVFHVVHGQTLTPEIYCDMAGYVLTAYSRWCTLVYSNCGYFQGYE